MVTLTEEDKRQMFDDAKNLWLSALFYNVSGYYHNISFKQQKEIFFLLIKDGLDGAIIKFMPPNHLWYEGYDIWDVSPDEIVAYLKDNFPKDATDELDEDVNLYFYITAPAVLWRQDDGSYYGS